ncbi:MAG: MBL fold metallo-hydrolase [Cyclobacteriaceae bacterium]
MIKIKSFTFNPFMENTYVLSDATGECIIIDPGCYETAERDTLKSYITKNGLKVVQLINTHCHIDHVLGNAFVKREYQVDLAIHLKDEATLESVKIYAPNYGFAKYEPSTANLMIDEGDQVKFGDSTLEILFVPGHAPGHVVFYHEGQSFCIGGDVLFRESIGRTDLPGGDHDVLISNIHEKMFKLPDDTTVYCGHGPETTIGHEKKFNPFCAISK